MVYIPRGGAPYWCIDAFDVLPVGGPLSDEMLAVEPRLLKKLLRLPPPPDWLGSMPSVAKRSWCDGAAGFWRSCVPALCGRRRLFADDGGEATPKNPSCDRRSPFIFFQVTEPLRRRCWVVKCCSITPGSEISRRREERERESGGIQSGREIHSLTRIHALLPASG